MDMKTLINEEPVIAGVNIVPVIDLCLVLLIILMVTSPLLETVDLPVKLPRASTIESKERNISVTYSPDGRLAINSDIVEEKHFISSLSALIRKDPDIMVILRVDKESPYLSLTELVERCKKAGARNVSVGTEQKKLN